MASQTARIRLREPHLAQRVILQHPARFKVVACGRRFGKTETGKIASIECAARGGLAWWVVPTFGIATKVWQDLKNTLAGATVYRSEADREITLPSGGGVVIKSAHEPDSLRGTGLDLAVIDEAAFMDAQAWTVLRPALADRRGRALFLSTPNGLNWFYQLFLKGQRGDPGWHSFQYASWENPYIARAEIEAARADTAELEFAEEYEAQFIDSTGAVFRDVAAACTAQPERAKPGHTYVFGVDWGRLNDFTAISVIDATESRQVALGRFTGIGWELQRARLIALYDEYRPSVIWCEANSIGQPNIEALQALGLPVKPFQTTAQSKGPLIDGLSLAMERGDLTLLNDPALVGELRSYRLERLPSGAFRYGAPPGGHDDTVISTAISWYGCTRGQRKPVTAEVVRWA